MRTVTDTAVQGRADIGKNVSQIVKILMALRGWDQAALAEQIGKPPSSISKLLAGNLRWSLEDVARLAQVFDRPISLFFEPAESLVRNRCFRQPEQLILDLETAPMAEQLTLIVSPKSSDRTVADGGDDGTEPLAA